MGAMKRVLSLSVACATAFGMTACTRAIGPKSMTRDRQLYAASLSDSWKEQTLLNIVKMRYFDPPIFVDVGNIVASYSLVQGVTVGGNIKPNGQTPDATIGGFGTYSNTPTITNTPLTGSKFIRGLATPLPPEAVFSSIRGRATGRPHPVHVGGVDQWLEKSGDNVAGDCTCRSGLSSLANVGTPYPAFGGGANRGQKGSRRGDGELHEFSHEKGATRNRVGHRGIAATVGAGSKRFCTRFALAPYPATIGKLRSLRAQSLA
jgi:hypothetical protein